MEGRYNARSPAVKRLMKEAQELSEPTDQYYAQPLEDNLFEWHFTVRGPADSDFQNGIYHGRIVLPVDYPMKPPSIIWLTPNGRFETNKKICLSISGHHPESWQPSWSIRTALLAIIGFMPTHPGGAVGSLDYKPEERKLLAKKSRAWKCPTCGDVSNILLERNSESPSTSKEVQELAAQISFQGEKPKTKSDNVKVTGDVLEKKNEDPKPESTSKATSSSTSPKSPNHITQTIPPKSVISGEANNNTSGCALPKQTSTCNRGQAFNVPASAPSIFSAPPWNTSPPFYCGQPPPCSMSSVPRFPYPPSYYSSASSSFYPPGYALPPGVGMFPCPFPPPYQPTGYSPNRVSINNSSAPSSTQGQRTNTTVTYARSPMTCPSAPCRPSYVATTWKCMNVQPTENESERAERKVVLNELLTKVKRVESESDEQESEKDASKGTYEEHGEPIDANSTDVDGGNIVKENPDITISLKTKTLGGDVIINEIMPTDTENSEADAPPIEVSESEQKSILEKSMCNSMSELDKSKVKQPTPKGLRQMQSATASVPTETGEEGQSAPDPSVTISGQRIEAESGDSGTRMRLRPGAPGSRVAQPSRGTVQRAQTRRSPFDFTFFLMIMLLLGIVGILVNRVLMIYWTDEVAPKQN